MNSLLDDDEDDPPADRELTLSTGAILSIFFGIVLLCGLFFGFGYKMGSHKPAQPTLAAAPEASTPTATNFDSFKPAAGSPVGSTTVTPAAHPTAPTHPAADTPEPEPTRTAPAAQASTPPPAQPSPVATAVPAGSFVVQVAAFTHPEDADLLVHALKVKGYPAFARSEPQDKLQHIQVGPFTNRKDAEAAKQKLLADGYQPILK
jgi:DedD protein